MAAKRKMTRQIQIGLSHSERAKKLSLNGYYEAALEELHIALDAFKSENADGAWDETLAGLLNNIGFVNVFLMQYEAAEAAFEDALAIKKRIGDQRSLVSTLIGLSDACRASCRFEESSDCLAEALDIALYLRDAKLALQIVESLDTLDRSKNGLPDRVYLPVAFDELYMPPLAADISVAVRNIVVEARSPDKLKLSIDMGFPDLRDDIDVLGSAEPLFPCLAVFVPNAAGNKLIGHSVTDEEESEVRSSATNFSGALYAPGSYHRCGPLPMPSCKRFKYTFGDGYLFQWKVSANGWYHAEAAMNLKGLDESLNITIVLPFESVCFHSLELKARKPLVYDTLTATAGTFVSSKALALGPGLPAFSRESTLYDGSLHGRIELDAGVTMQYGVLHLNFIK